MTMLSVFMFALAVAQDTMRAPELELGEAYRIARVANPRAAAARELAAAAEARVAGSKLPPDPEVQLGFMNYGVPDLARMEPLGMTQIQLMQIIPIAGKLGYAGRASGAEAGAARERARDVEWEVRSQVAMAFYDLYATDRALTVARETLRQRRAALMFGLYLISIRLSLTRAGAWTPIIETCPPLRSEAPALRYAPVSAPEAIANPESLCCPRASDCRLSSPCNRKSARWEWNHRR